MGWKKKFIDLDKLGAMRSGGLNVTQMAHELGVHRQTFYEWLNRNTELKYTYLPSPTYLEFYEEELASGKGRAQKKP